MSVLASHRYCNSRPGSASVLEFPDEANTTAPLKETVISGEVNGPLAGIVVSQLFDCSFLPENTAAEAVYRFPLPGDALILGVCAVFGETTVRTTLLERKEAEEKYEKAKKDGRQGALVTREAEDVFTLRLAGVTRSDPVRVETNFLLWLPPTDDGFSLRIPLTVAPRYIRGDEERNPRRNASPLDVRWDPGHRTRLSLRCTGFLSAECSSNALRVDRERDEDAMRLSFEEGEVFPDQDLVLRFRNGRGEHPRLEVFSGPDGAFLALVTPPERVPVNAPPREVLLLVDHSGSMEGAKWEASDWAVRSFLSKLGEDDLFNVGFFHNTCRWMEDGPVEAIEGNRTRGIRFIEEARDSGGTKLGAAIEQALMQRRSADGFARHVVIVTDGQICDFDRISLLLRRERERGDARRVSVLCIDSAPNEPLARNIAEKGRGICRFLSSNPDDADIATALDEIFEEFSRPLATGTRLVSREPLSANSGETVNEDGSLDLGDLPSKRARWICGRAKRSGERFELYSDDSRLVASTESKTVSGQFAGAIRALEGTLRVRALEGILGSMDYIEAEEAEATLIALGLPAGKETETSLYPENRNRSLREHVESLLLKESLERGVPCFKTAFVAVREERGIPVSRSYVVPNALPRAWEPGFAPRMQLPSPDAFFGDTDGAMLSSKRINCMSMTISSPINAYKPPDDEDEFSMCGSAAPEERTRRASSPVTCFDGRLPSPEEPSLLFECVAGEGPLEKVRLLKGIVVDGLGKSAGTSDARAALRILVNGAPVACVSIADLQSFKGRRPLNIRLRVGDRLALHLDGERPKEAPRMKISLLTE
jgi:Ca-activated chloride channel family protein